MSDDINSGSVSSSFLGSPLTLRLCSKRVFALIIVKLIKQKHYAVFFVAEDFWPYVESRTYGHIS